MSELLESTISNLKTVARQAKESNIPKDKAGKWILSKFKTYESPSERASRNLYDTRPKAYLQKLDREFARLVSFTVADLDKVINEVY